MQNENKRYTLIIENRKSVTLNGVENVIGFDEGYVALSTEQGRVVIEGEDLKIESLTRDNGEIFITGAIASLYFADEKGKSGIFKRIFK